mmetsp:Transcript_127/g.334  ORF Transcript_127/g.334 Transcript_127/m.334 type:complete len:209 (+) Transcript_127:435-1061(+)
MHVCAGLLLGRDGRRLRDTFRVDPHPRAVCGGWLRAVRAVCCGWFDGWVFFLLHFFYGLFCRRHCSGHGHGQFHVSGNGAGSGLHRAGTPAVVMNLRVSLGVRLAALSHLAVLGALGLVSVPHFDGFQLAGALGLGLLRCLCVLLVLLLGHATVVRPVVGDVGRLGSISRVRRVPRVGDVPSRGVAGHRNKVRHGHGGSRVGGSRVDV